MLLLLLKKQNPNNIWPFAMMAMINAGNKRHSGLKSWYRHKCFLLPFWIVDNTQWERERENENLLLLLTMIMVVVVRCWWLFTKSFFFFISLFEDLCSVFTAAPLFFVQKKKDSKSEWEKLDGPKKKARANEQGFFFTIQIWSYNARTMTFLSFYLIFLVVVVVERIWFDLCCVWCGVCLFYMFKEEEENKREGNKAKKPGPTCTNIT